MKKILSIFLSIAVAVVGAMAGAQETKRIPRIGYLSLAARPSPRDEAFVQGLRELGWIDGQNSRFHRMCWRGRIR
jgi:hypothetical protein